MLMYMSMNDLGHKSPTIYVLTISFVMSIV